MNKKYLKDVCIAWLDGAQAARDLQALPDLLEVWTASQKNAYIDGFTAMRTHMSHCSMILLPQDPKKGDGVFRKAADCVG